MSKVTCPICSRQFKQITKSHPEYVSPLRNVTAHRIWSSDIIKVNYLISKSYRICTIWESYIKDDFDIMEYINFGEPDTK